ncbi:Six-hairpin glycosidase [Phytophthora cactorum]|nr:Six-hairpin glycosidase [Phytophthora cactorum]
MKSFLFPLIAAAMAAVTTASNDLLYSTRMIESVMSRKQGVVSSGAVTSTLDTYGKDGDSARVANFTKYADSIVTSTSPTFKSPEAAAKMPLDRLTIGQALLHIKATEGTLTSAESETLSLLNSSLTLQTRNKYNGFWYYVYPNWSYLDGTIELLYLNTYDKSTALTAVWANKVTGASPYVWGRSLGWYLAGLVNAWEKLGDCSGGSNAACVRLTSAIQKQASQLCKSIATYADKETGVWWQLPTLGGKQGNFLESSSTMLYTFSILKGLRLAFLLDYHNGTLGWNGTVAVCSLNSTATYEYYVGRPIVHNHALGEGAFILASLEMERFTN